MNGSGRPLRQGSAHGRTGAVGSASGLGAQIVGLPLEGSAAQSHEQQQLSGEALAVSAETSSPVKDTDAMTQGNQIPETLRFRSYRTYRSYPDT